MAEAELKRRETEVNRLLKSLSKRQPKEASAAVPVAQAAPAAPAAPVASSSAPKKDLYVKRLLQNVHSMIQSDIDKRDELAALQMEEMNQKEERRQGRRALRRKYLEAQSVLNDPTEERNAFRARILSVSLFPNVFNQETIMTSLGPS